jgi:hypothetical protein
MTLEGGGRSAIPVQGNAATGGTRPIDSEGPTAEPDHQGVMPIEDTSHPQAIAPH